MRRCLRGILAVLLLTLPFVAGQPGRSLAAAGESDAAFGRDGLALAQVGDETVAAALAVQSDGKLIVAGSARFYEPDDSYVDFAVARFNPDGSLDAGFGSGGTLTTNFGGDDFASAAAVQPDGKIVVAGIVHNGRARPFCVHDCRPPSPLDSNGSHFGLARYHPDGSLDEGFGGGKVIRSLGPGFSGATALTLLPDGRIVAVGFGAPTGRRGFAVLRLLPDGSSDESFGAVGVAAADFGNGGDEALSVAVQPDGKLVVVGTANVTIAGLFGSASQSPGFGLARFNPDGTLDGTFGSGGKLTPRMLFGEGSTPQESARSVAIQPDGKLVVAGYSSFSTALLRLNPDGRADASFGQQGKLTARVGGGNWERSLLIQPDGKLVVASSFTLARFTPDGSPDEQFAGGNGTTTFRSGLSARGLAQQADGGLALAITASSRDGASFGLMRYLASTAPDEAAAPCRFRGDFQTLHDKLPDIVGGCLEDERLNPDTGALEQRTTGGLLLKHPGAHFPVFTNDTTTWVLGPLGLMSRANTDPPITWETFSAGDAQARATPTPNPKLAGLPELGEVVVEDPLTSPGLLRAQSCPTRKNEEKFVDEGLSLTVMGRCFANSESAVVIKTVRGLTFRDGEIRFELQGTVAPERLTAELWLRYQRERGWYELTILPVRRELRLNSFVDNQFNVLTTAVDRYSSLIPDGWNSYAVRAKGDRFWVLLNDEPVQSGTSGLLDSGEVSLAISRVGPADDEQPVTTLVRNFRVTNLAGTEPSRASTYEAPPPRIGRIYFLTDPDYPRRAQNDRNTVPAGTTELYTAFDFADVLPPNTIHGYFIRDGVPDPQTASPHVPRIPTGYSYYKWTYPEGLRPGTLAFVVELNGAEAARRDLVVE